MKKRILCLMLLVLTVLAVSVLCLASCDEEPTSEYIRVTFKTGESVSDVQWPSDAFNASNYRAAKPEIPFGHTFEGWYSLDGMKYFDADGKKVPNLLIDRDILLVAQFTPKEFSFVFGSGDRTFADGTNEKRVAYTYGTLLPDFPAPVLADPSLELDGYFDANGTRYSNGTVPVAQHLTQSGYPALQSEIKLHAAYKTRTFTVTLDYNDGSSAPVTFTRAYGEKLGDLSAYGKDNGTQSIYAWSVDRYAENPPAATVTSDLRLYAVWRSYKTVGFVMPDGSLQAERVFDTGNRVPLPVLGFPGYKLVGWHLTNSLSGNRVESVHFGNMQDTYYGMWEETDYVINFACEGGLTFESIRYEYGQAVTLPTPELAGHTFYGWYTDDPEHTVLSLPVGTWGDLHLTAKLVPDTYTVLLNANGGTLSVNHKLIGYGSVFSLPVPTKEGYTFLGWYNTAENGTPVADRNGVGLLAWNIAQDNTVLYAHWEIKTYTVSFQTAGGTAVPSENYRHGDLLTLPAAPKKTGVVFLGWFDASGKNEYTPSTRITSDLTLYAKWVESNPVFDVQSLLAIKDNPTANYHLVADIDMGGKQWTPIPEFSGILNGQGYAIKNMTLLDNNTLDNFAFISVNKGEVRNLRMENTAFDYRAQNRETYAAVLVAQNNGLIANCHVIGGSFKLDTSQVGRRDYHGVRTGVLAGLNKGTVRDCYTNMNMTCDVTAFATKNTIETYHGALVEVGGAVGSNRGNIINCKVSQTIVATSHVKRADNNYSGGATTVNLGGLVATSDAGRIEYCAISSDITVTYGTVAASFNWDAYHAGGLIGICSGETAISNCVVSGKVTGRHYNTTPSLGGFVGVMYAATNAVISNCYTTASAYDYGIRGYEVRYGGFCGRGDNGLIKNCYAAPKDYTANRGFSGFADNVSGTATENCMTTVAPFSENNKGATTNCHTKPDGVDEEFLFGTLGWDETVWEIGEDGLPTLIGVELP